MQTMSQAGVKVLRTWVSEKLKRNVFLLTLDQGFNAINGSELAGAEQSGLTYYQVLHVLMESLILLM